MLKSSQTVRHTQKQSWIPKMKRPVSLSLESESLPKEIKEMVEKGVVHKIFAEQTKEEGIGRFVVELIRKCDDDYTAYEIFHWKKHFVKTNPITSVGHDSNFRGGLGYS